MLESQARLLGLAATYQCETQCPSKRTLSWVCGAPRPVPDSLRRPSMCFAPTGSTPGFQLRLPAAHTGAAIKRMPMRLLLKG